MQVMATSNDLSSELDKEKIVYSIVYVNNAPVLKNGLIHLMFPRAFRHKFYEANTYF